MKASLFLFLIAAILVPLKLHGQEINIKEGAYRNLYEFHKNYPFIKDVEFTFHPLRKEGIYRAKSDSKKTNAEVLSFGSWAIYQDSTFYINLQRLGMGSGFTKILELGRHSLFVGRPATTVDQRKRLYKNSFYFGLVGVAASTLIIGKELSDNDLFILNLNNGVPENIDVNHMELILRDEIDLYNKYMMEPNKESLEIMVLYLRKLNKRLPLF